MLLKLFGLFDLICAVGLLLLHFDIIGWRFMFGFAAYLFIKAYMFKGDYISLIDFLAGVYFVLLFFGVKTFLVYFFAAFLLQKAFFSLKF